MILFTVRSNRAKRMQRNRVGQLTTPRPVTAGTDSGVCPMCGDPLPQDHDAINTHVDLCLSGGGPVDTEGRVEEYTWAGQTRVRATALMEGDYAASGFVVHKKTDRDTDEDVDIDNDDEQAFGDAQYGEQDLQAVSNEPSKEQDNIVNIRASLGIDDEEGIDIETYRPEDVDLSVLHNVAPSSKLIIESLKERVRDLESHTRTAPKCLICLEPYKDPVVSIICWHVHCEKCWLQTLAAKKLCPQDSRITSASDLRRIYF
ncbi:CG4813-like protein [Cladochytrium replicatum]|nr:CG4813-like protein [Cladochytrium replicatum]